MTAVKMKNKLIALLLSVLYMTLIFAPNIEAKGDAVTISSAKDYFNLVKDCKTDTFSRGKTVILLNDIDLSHTDFKSIPTFGGTFKGNGHKITGVNISSKGSYLGLFRYLQKGAFVENLDVEGIISPKGSQKYIGGIAGENSGIIKNCSFDGSVSGKSAVGGICGIITSSGSVIGCHFEGSAVSDNYTGGIAGQNYGIIESCVNKGSINTTGEEESKSIQDIDIKFDKLRTTESIDAATDTGGICGFSKGRIENSSNYGAVGYKSIGYNTGGICGRQSGYISGCENYGIVNGRKDIGGICGQAEPYILLEYTEDALKRLDGVFSEIQNILSNDSILKDKELEKSIDNVDSAISSVASASKPLSEDLKAYTDAVTNTLEDLSERMHVAIDSSSEVFDLISLAGEDFAYGTNAFSESGEYLKTVTDKLADAAKSAEKAGEHMVYSATYLENASQKISRACRELEIIARDLNDNSKALREAINNLSAALKNNSGIKESFTKVGETLEAIQKDLYGAGNSLDDITDVLTYLSESGAITENLEKVIDSLKNIGNRYRDIANAISAVGESLIAFMDGFDGEDVRDAFKYLSQGFTYLSKAMRSMKLASDDLSDALSHISDVRSDAKNAITNLQKGLDRLESGLDKLSDSADKLSDIADEISANGKLQVPEASEIFGDDYDDFIDCIIQMQSEFSALKDILQDKKHVLSDKADSINSEIDNLSDILTDIYDEHISSEEKELVEDISDKDANGIAMGKIELSVNNGKVYGDVNTGGIVGSMAIEYDFDPEDDIKDGEEKSLKFTYKTKCIVRRCKNCDTVTSKKDCCGGIVGRMDLGSVLYCENYGGILNKDGDYTGAIAGLSDTVIRYCAAKCKIEGQNYIGGIAGKGDTIKNCHTIVYVPQLGECVGSIAGEASIEKLSGNYFVSDMLGAIDDINYTGMAEEAQVEDFVAFVEANMGTRPEFTLTFVADDKEIAVVQFTYKSAIPKDKIPAVPQKKGYYGKWSDYNFDEACYDEVIYANYYRSVELIESDLKRSSGKSVVMACGAFNDLATVNAVKIGDYPKKLKHKNVLDAYEISVENVYSDKYIIRYLPSSEKESVAIYAENGSDIIKLKTKKRGSYMEFEVDFPVVKIYEVRRTSLWIIWIAIIIVLLGGIVFVLIKKNRLHLHKQKK